jgi:hypothetical protein
MEVVYREESYRIMGACFEVYREMGCGFLSPNIPGLRWVEVVGNDSDSLSSATAVVAFVGF